MRKISEMDYGLITWGHEYTRLFRKVSGVYHVLASQQSGEWLLFPNNHFCPAFSEWDASEITEAEAHMILFQCVEPVS